MKERKPQHERQPEQTTLDQRLEAQRAADRVARQTPRETSVGQLEQVLVLGGLDPARARLIVRAYIDKQREVKIPRYPSGAVMPAEESRIVTEHLREAVDRLIAGCFALYSIRLGADSLCSYVCSIMEDRKQARLAAEEAARKKAEAEAKAKENANEERNSKV